MPAIEFLEFPLLDSTLIPKVFLRRARHCSALIPPYHPFTGEGMHDRRGGASSASSNLHGTSYLRNEREVDIKSSHGRLGITERGSTTPASIQIKAEGALEQDFRESDKSGSYETASHVDTSLWTETWSPVRHLGVSTLRVFEVSGGHLLGQHEETESYGKSGYRDEEICCICRRNQVIEITTCTRRITKSNSEHDSAYCGSRGGEHLKSTASRIALIPRMCLYITYNTRDENLQFLEKVVASHRPPQYGDYRYQSPRSEFSAPPGGGGGSQGGGEGKGKGRDDDDDWQGRHSGGDERGGDEGDEEDGNEETEPPKKIPKKTPMACHFCRGRKLKCDGGRPTCGNCAGRRLACKYDKQPRRRGPGRKTKSMMLLRQHEEFRQPEASSSMTSLASSLYRYPPPPFTEVPDLPGPPRPEYPYPIGQIPRYSEQPETRTAETSPSFTQQSHHLERSAQQPQPSQRDRPEQQYHHERTGRPYLQQWQVPPQQPQPTHRQIHEQVQAQEPSYSTSREPSGYRSSWPRETEDTEGHPEDRNNQRASGSRSQGRGFSPSERFDPTGHHRKRESG